MHPTTGGNRFGRRRSHFGPSRRNWLTIVYRNIKAHPEVCHGECPCAPKGPSDLGRQAEDAVDGGCSPERGGHGNSLPCLWCEQEGTETDEALVVDSGLVLGIGGSRAVDASAMPAHDLRISTECVSCAG